MTMGREPSRRAVASVSALAVPFALTPSIDPDAELLALSAEVLRMSAMVSEFNAARIEPFDEKFELLIHDRTREWEVRWADAAAWNRKTGRGAAIEELGDLDKETDQLFRRMMAIPATTQPGRAAKVRVLLVHVMRDKWRGPA